MDAADFDGDGDADIIAGSITRFFGYENRGNGVFGPRQIVGPASVDTIHVADMNSDGAPDVLAAFRYSNLIAWHRGGFDFANLRCVADDAFSSPTSSWPISTMTPISIYSPPLSPRERSQAMRILAAGNSGPRT